MIMNASPMTSFALLYRANGQVPMPTGRPLSSRTDQSEKPMATDANIQGQQRYQPFIYFYDAAKTLAFFQTVWLF